MIPVVFILNLIIWICLISLFAQLGSYKSIIALFDQNFVFFSNEFLHSILYYAPFAAMLALINVFLFLMRHATFAFLSIPLVVFLSVFLVLIIAPFSIQLNDHFSQNTMLPDSTKEDERFGMLSSGYIREDSEYKRAIWFSASFPGNQVSPIIIANRASHPGFPALLVYSNGLYSENEGSISSDETVLVTHAGGNDSLLIPSLKKPAFIRSFGKDIRFVLDRFNTVQHRDSRLYLALAGTFVFSVLALWALCYLTGWRFLNFLLVAAGFRLLFFMYPYTQEGVFFNIVLGFMPSSISSDFISPLILLFFTLVFLFAALIVLIVRKSSSSHSKATYV